MEDEEKNIVIYRTRGIGDVILSMYGMKTLYAKKLRIYYIGYGESLSIVQHFYPRVETIDISNASVWRAQKMIRNVIPKIHGFIDLQKNSKSLFLYILLYFSNQCNRYTWNKKSIRRRWIVFLNQITGRKIKPLMVKKYDQQHISDSFTNCFAACISDLKSISEKCPDDEKHNDVKTEPFDLIIAPGASHKAKKIPPEVIADILKDVEDALRLRIALIGGPNDIECCNSVEARIRHDFSTVNLCNTLSLVDVSNLIKNAGAVIAADSAIFHLAAFLKIPVMVLPGPTIEGFGYVHNQKNVDVFSVDINCSPCSIHGTRHCRYRDHRCMLEINTHSVAQRVNNILRQKKSL